jgi:hypothetical protein
LDTRARRSFRFDQHLRAGLVEQVLHDIAPDLHDLGQFGLQFGAMDVHGLHQDPQ